MRSNAGQDREKESAIRVNL